MKKNKKDMEVLLETIESTNKKITKKERHEAQIKIDKLNKKSKNKFFSNYD